MCELSVMVDAGGMMLGAQEIAPCAALGWLMAHGQPGVCATAGAAHSGNASAASRRPFMLWLRRRPSAATPARYELTNLPPKAFRRGAAFAQKGPGRATTSIVGQSSLLGNQTVPGAGIERLALVQLGVIGLAPYGVGLRIEKRQEGVAPPAGDWRHLMKRAT
jgi:hypothetical protein